MIAKTDRMVQFGLSSPLSQVSTMVFVVLQLSLSFGEGNGRAPLVIVDAGDAVVVSGERDQTLGPFGLGGGGVGAKAMVWSVCTATPARRPP